MSHHTGDVLKHCVHCGNIIFPLFSKDMECMSENCPSVMVDDHVRCWNSMNENVSGLSVTSPMFSDRNSDYALWRMAPVWYCCSLPTYMHSFIHDPYNKNYSGFIYLPQAFRMQSRLQQENLTTSSTCMQHIMDLPLGRGSRVI